MSRTLALDLGTHCGWALRSGDGLMSGTWDLRHHSSDRRGELYIRMHSYLVDLDVAFGGPPDKVYFEYVRRHVSTDSAHMYGGYLAILQAWCESWEPTPIPCIGLAVGTIKKRATGSGRADKSAMISAAQERWPKQKVKDDNQADALWILDCGLSMEDGSKG